MKRMLLAGIIPALLVAPSAFGAGEPSDVAKIRGKVLTNAELTSYTLLIQQNEGRYGSEPEQLVEDLVLQQTLGSAFTTVTLEDKAVKALPGRFKVPAQRGLIRRMFYNQLLGALKVPDEKISEWYNENKSRYETPEKVKAYHLFRSTSKDNPSSAPDTVRDNLEKIRAMMDKETTFGALAERYSEAASGARGGDIGWVSRRMPIGPESKPMNIVLENALFELRPGTVSDVLSTSHGMHLVFVADRVSTVTPTLQDLKTSGILPGVVANTMMTSEAERVRNQSLAKHGGKLLYTGDGSDITTDTKVFEFGGRAYTARDVELLYGQALGNAFRRARRSPGGVKDLYQKVLEDEAFLTAAEDAGVDKSAAVQRDLEFLAARAAFKNAFQEIVARDFGTDEKQVRAIYDREKDNYRRPMYEGRILTVKTDPKAAMRVKDEAETKAKAEGLLKKLKEGADFEKLAHESSQDNRATSGGLVEMHQAGSLADEAAQAFDMIVTSIAKEGELSGVQQTATGFAIAKLVKKDMGPPPPFEAVKAGLTRQAQGENEARARRELLAAVEAKKLVEWLPGSVALGKKPAATATVAPAAKVEITSAPAEKKADEKPAAKRTRRTRR